jgi:hypothetical protein
MTVIVRQEHGVKHLPRRLGAGAVAMLMALSVSTAASAEALVLSSEGAGDLIAGQVLPSGQTIVLAAGERAELLLETGAVVRLAGPARYLVPREAQSRPGFLRALAELLQPRAPQVRLGGVRSADEDCALGDSADWTAVADAWTAGCRRSAIVAAERLTQTAGAAR